MAADPDQPDAPPAPSPEDTAPATQEDLRVLRRWVIVAGVWAVAATAIGIIALLDTSGTDAEKQASDASDRAAAVERSVDQQNAQIKALEKRLDDLPQTADVSKLEDRLSAAEDDASKAAEDAKSADEKVTDLEDRVQTLEDESGTGDGTGDGTGGLSP